jgi:hypothetical protein
MIRPAPRLAPALFVLTGAAWAFRSLLEFASPQYYEPVTPLDWLAVLSYSVAFFLLAGSVTVLARLAPRTRFVRTAAAATVIGAVLAGAANLVEDGLDVQALGAAYVTGALLTLAGLLALAAALAVAGRRRLALVPLATAIGMMAFVAGGGVLVLVAWVWLAVVVARAPN